MSQLAETTTDPLAKRVRYILDARNLQDIELARHIGITASTFSKALRRPRALEGHIAKIADFFGLKEKELTGDMPEGELVKRMKRRAPEALRKVQLTSPLLVRIAREAGIYGKGKWALLAERTRSPVRGELVAYQTSEEADYIIRRFSPSDGVVGGFLTHPHDPQGIQSITQDEVKFLRVVIAICDYIDTPQAGT